VTEEDDEKLQVTSELTDQLSKLNFDVGEVCTNLNYSDTLDAIYQQIFPHQDPSEVLLIN
jgi:hypothetical protein